MKVNGAGGSSGGSGGGGPSGPSSSSSSSSSNSENLSDKGYPSSTTGYNPNAKAEKEFGDTYSANYIKNNVPEQYQQQALDALKKEEQAGLYGSPTDSKRVTAGVGGKTNLQDVHTGVDIGAKTPGVAGDPIYATADGTVLRNGKTGSGSTRVEISLPYTNDTAVYQHANFIVKEGETVERGQIIGYMSDQGTSGEVHLHYEIREGGQYTQDPSKIVDPLNHMPSTYSKQ